MVLMLMLLQTQQLQLGDFLTPLVLEEVYLGSMGFKEDHLIIITIMVGESEGAVTNNTTESITITDSV